MNAPIPCYTLQESNEIEQSASLNLAGIGVKYVR